MIVFTPKSLLRHPEAKSSFDDMIDGTEFQRVIPDVKLAPRGQVNEAVKRIVLCTGKVFYELNKERTTRGMEDKVAIVRVEQLCPFPWDELAEVVKQYPNADVIWSQEEHKNQGWWPWMQSHMDTVLRHLQTGKHI